MNFKEHVCLDRTIIISFPNDWIVKEKDSNLLKVNFPIGPYPVLDCYINCFDNPKINSGEKINKYLLGGIDSVDKIENLSENIYILKHKFKSDGDNLLLFKLINVIKPRTFREVRFSLAWPDNEEANKVVDNISKVLEIVINKIKFSKIKTSFDEIGVTKNKLSNLILEKNVFWENLEIFFPKRWKKIENSLDKSVIINVEREKNLNLFFEFFEIKINKENENNNKIVTNFINEITKDVLVEEQSLVKADENNYLFSFYSIENNTDESVKNHIWYRMCIKSSYIKIVSFIFTYKIELKNIGILYYHKINDLIKSAELN
ncbi:MAG: hypothetical protein CBC22_03270 [Alphaproteobacteria bacterium TMED62]|nr:MAG: hypothetical protein CBC22_03270 [Alphaproteobacteria bacterium TMED62]|tara:strand:- start:3369 stop:4322 length:954 start_codon:yes stop_codon:yes gene_type:complete